MGLRARCTWSGIITTAYRRNNLLFPARQVSRTICLDPEVKVLTMVGIESDEKHFPLPLVVWKHPPIMVLGFYANRIVYDRQCVCDE